MSIAAVLDENGEADAHCFQIGGMGATPQPVAPPVVASVAMPTQVIPPQHADRVAVAAGVKPPMSTRELLAQLRARLRVVDREIKTRKAFESERGQIQRLIHAATEDRNNVRRIRAAG